MGSPPTVADMMAAYALDAQDHAQASSNVTLDHSPESIRLVEEILDRLHAAVPRGFLGRLLKKAPSQDDLWTMSKMYGGYIGEVFRKAGGGEWGLDTEIVPGQNTVCLRKEQRRIWPPSKVYKRLTAGPQDNVWVYSQVILQDW